MPVLGGALAYARIETETDRTEALLRDLTTRIAAAPRITVMTEATATGCFADNLLSVMQGDRMIKLRAGSIVVATGALDQPMVFRNNDLPGIMMGSAAERLIGLYGVRSEEHTSELQSLMRISYAVFCLKKKIDIQHHYYAPTNFTLTTISLHVRYIIQSSHSLCPIGLYVTTNTKVH